MTSTPDRSIEPGRSRPTRLPRWLTAPMARLYAREIGRRNRNYDRGAGVERIDRPVISVGNLSAGGTGKTPMVRWVVSELQAMGRRPAIAMRGYKAADGQASDEQTEHAEAMPGVPIVAQPDRIAGLRALFETDAGAGVDCVVLDDGFQHRRLARDLDIVLIDATRPAHEDALIPHGFLREGLASLSRADAVVITRSDAADAEQLDAIERSVDQHTSSGVPIVRAEHRWVGLDVHDDRGGVEAAGVPRLAGQRLFVCCAIGNPDAFVRAIERADGEVCGSMILKDHASFDSGVVDRLVRESTRSGGRSIFVTPKDWVKLRTAWRGSGGLPVAVPRVEMAIAPSDGLSGLLASVFSDG